MFPSHVDVCASLSLPATSLLPSLPSSLSLKSINISSGEDFKKSGGFGWK